eukprot:3905490-Pyramimonas_sp.AAC.1
MPGSCSGILVRASECGESSGSGFGELSLGGGRGDGGPPIGVDVPPIGVAVPPIGVAAPPTGAAVACAGTEGIY